MSEEKEKHSNQENTVAADATRSVRSDGKGAGEAGGRSKMKGKRTMTGATKPFRRSRRRGRERPKSEFEMRKLSQRKVFRMTTGGRRMRYSVAVAVGNKKGSVGVATGKGTDVAIATEKAREKAKKRLVVIELTEDNGITCETAGKYCASMVQIRPANGFVAGGAVRVIAELAGIQNINAKILSRSKNHLNNARATLQALSQIKK